MPSPVLKTLRRDCIPRPGRAQMRRIFGSGGALTRAGHGLHCHSGGRLAAVTCIAGLHRRLEAGSFPVLSHLRGCLVPHGRSQGPDGSTNTLGEAPPGGIPRVPSPLLPRIRRNVLHPCTPVPEDSPEGPESTHQIAAKCLSHREKALAKGIKGFEGIRSIQKPGTLSEQASHHHGGRRPGFCSKEGVLNGSTHP